MVFILFLGLISELLIFYFKSKEIHFENLIFNLYVFLELLLIYYVFTNWLFSYKVHKKISTYLVICFSIIWLLSNLRFINNNHFDQISNGMSDIIIITMSVFYFYQKIKKPDSLFIYSTAHFWFVSAFFVYASATFFIFLFFDNLTSLDQQNRVLVYFINKLFYVIKQILIAVGFSRIPEKNNSNNKLKESFLDDYKLKKV